MNTRLNSWLVSQGGVRDPGGDVMAPEAISVDTMTPHQIAMFEGGFAAYADGVPRELITSLPIDSASKGWALKGWDASKETNESLQRQFKRSET